MTPLWRQLVVAFCFFAAATPLVQARPAAAARQTDSSRYIVVLQDDVRDPRVVANEHARGHGARVSAVHRFALKGYTADISAAEVRRLTADRRVRSVERDQPVSAFAQTTPSGLDRTAVPADPGLLGTKLTIDGLDDRRVDVDIAVLDTGVHAGHLDLNVAQTTDCTNGCLDGSGADGNGHGTHVAGTAVALDNDFGIVGVAPGARLWSVKVLADNGSASSRGSSLGSIGSPLGPARSRWRT